MTAALDILKKYWGYDQFRPLQQDIITAVLQKKDTLAILPTGGGKSICFQVPALACDGICLVVSPLIALIKDQVENLKRNGIGALAVYSGMSFLEVKQTLQNAAFGNYKFLYVSPERLETKLFLEFLPAIKPSLIAVDEAHCISQWGYDFRPSYLHIANLRQELPGVPVIALTASATLSVQNDICNNLLFDKTSMRFQQSFLRPNLSYSIFNPPSKENKLLEILKNVGGSSIVYCKSRKQTQVVTAFLRSSNVQSDFYHAGLTPAERTLKQDDWIKNKMRVIVCTNAFGMGIDKPDVRTVIHYEVPDCMENYYQEAGRAGRDGKRAYAVLLHHKKETADLRFKLDSRYPSPEKLRLIYISLMNYLQVAAGTGEGLSFDVDVAGFAQGFKLNILEASHGIQALAREELLSFNEYTFKQNTAVFSVSKSDLQEFENQHPELDYLVKGLLRSYEGIFDQPSPVYEYLLAKFLKCSADKIIADLKTLHLYNIISYASSSGKPQIFLLKNRMYNDDIKIDGKDMAARKGHAVQRVKDITGFIDNHTTCRSRMIGIYFGDNNITNCGICDNCINNTSAELPPAEFENAIVKIKIFVEEGQKSLKDIFRFLKPLRERSVWLVIQFLLAEEILLTNENVFVLNTKNNGQKKGTQIEI